MYGDCKRIQDNEGECTMIKMSEMYRNETVIEIIGEIREATEEEKEAYERQLETEIDWREVLLSKFLKNH